MAAQQHPAAACSPRPDPCCLSGRRCRHPTCCSQPLPTSTQSAAACLALVARCSRGPGEVQRMWPGPRPHPAARRRQTYCPGGSLAASSSKRSCLHTLLTTNQLPCCAMICSGLRRGSSRTPARTKREAAHGSDEEAATSVPAAEGQQQGLSVAFLDENVSWGVPGRAHPGPCSTFLAVSLSHVCSLQGIRSACSPPRCRATLT